MQSELSSEQLWVEQFGAALSCSEQLCLQLVYAPLQKACPSFMWRIVLLFKSQIKVFVKVEDFLTLNLLIFPGDWSLRVVVH